MKPLLWRRSRFGKFLRHMPRVKHIRGTWLHRRLGDRLFDPHLWHPTRQRFAAGLAVGAFFAMMPAPLQMVAAALIAYITRVNIPAAIVGTWISNPFTFPLCIYAQYRLGCFLIGSHPSDAPTHDLIATLKHAPVPFIVGVLPSATLLAIIVYPVTLLVWDFVTARLAAHHRRHHSVPQR